MVNILKKKRYSQADIQSIIDFKLEESINIEFKSGGSLNMNDHSKKEISKDVSAMANSDGGIIVYGVKEINHVASELSFIDGRIITKEWIENVIISNVQQRIEDIRILPVRFDNKLEQTVFILLIPKSNNNPHMCSDKKYYRRFNFQAVAMEEYEVRNSYNRVGSSKLFMQNFNIGNINFSHTNINVPIYIDVANDGKAVEEKYKVGCWLKLSKKIGYNYSISSSYDLTIDNEYGLKFSTTRNSPIFPQEFVTVLSFTLTIPLDHYDTHIQGAVCTVLIYTAGKLLQEVIDLESMLKSAIPKAIDTLNNYN